MGYTYDAKHDILTISKVPVAKKKYEYEVSDTYKSYKEFIDKELFMDLNEFLIKPLNKKIMELVSLYDVVNVDWKETALRNTTELDYKGYVRQTVRLKFENGVSFDLLELPEIDEYGILHKGKLQKAIIGELVQADDITFDEGKNENSNELKIVMESGNFVNLKRKATSLTTTINKKQYDMVELLYALARKEGFTEEQLLNMEAILKHLPLVATTYKPDRFEFFRNYAYEEMDGEYNPLQILESDRYKMGSVRNKVNSVLSLDRALNKRLKQDVNVGDTIFPAGTLLTKNILRKIKSAGVHTIYVEYMPKKEGNVLREDVFMHCIRKGTPLLDCFRPYFNAEGENNPIKFPQQKGRYVDNDYIAQVGVQPLIIVPSETEITEELLEALAYNEIDCVQVAENKSTQKVEVVYFSLPIVSNHSVEKEDGQFEVIKDDGSLAPEERNYITAYDVLAMLAFFDRLVVGEDVGFIASRDLGLRKKVNLTKELYRKVLRKACASFLNSYSNKIARELGKGDVTLRDAELLTSLFAGLTREFDRALNSSKCIQVIDSTNPLSFYSSLDKINAITASKHAISENMRAMTMGHYGRLCPYEEPSGMKLGVVNNKTILCKVVDGVMKTPYRRIVKKDSRLYAEPEWIYLSVDEEEKYRIADIVSMGIDEEGWVHCDGSVLARIPDQNSLEKVTIQYVDVEHIDFVNVDPQQSMSLTTATIPFIGADDAARVTFADSMFKQAKGLVNPEVPYVMTSAYIDVLMRSPHFMIHAEKDGVVKNVHSSVIEVLYDGEKEPKAYSYNQCEYSLQSVIIRVPEVEEGQRVKQGDILLSSNFVKDGIYATGVNALICYIPTGYNYEDGIYASERLKYRLTSYKVNTETKQVASNVESCNIKAGVDCFKYVYPEEVCYKREQSYASTSVTEKVKSEDLKGFLVDVYCDVGEQSRRITGTVAKAISLNPMEPGDKTANRHGNKGVNPKLAPNKDMPQFKNGEFVDLAYNPMGVPSRMNIGQIKECNLAFAGHIMQCRYNSDSFNGADEEIAEQLEIAYRLANEDDAEAVLNDYPHIPREWKEERLRKLDWIRGWKGCFNKDGTAWMYNPRTGKLFGKPVTVGVNYLYKLIQEVATKVHARGGYIDSRYVKKFSAPTEGASKGGGQRMGEMELAGIAAYGAADYIYELENDRGDNPVARSNFTAERVTEGNLYMLDPKTGIRRSVEEFIYKLEALGVVVEFTDGELPNTTREELRKRKVFRSSALLLKSLKQDEGMDVDTFAAGIRGDEDDGEDT